MLAGLAHRTLAGPVNGLKTLEIWSQSIDPQVVTPSHQHDCEEVMLIIDGEGVLTMQGKQTRFRAGDTVIIPRGEVHQVVNDGGSALRLIGALGMAPVRVQFPDGTPIPLPWQQEQQA